MRCCFNRPESALSGHTDRGGGFMRNTTIPACRTQPGACRYYRVLGQAASTLQMPLTILESGGDVGLPIVLHHQFQAVVHACMYPAVHKCQCRLALSL